MILILLYQVSSKVTMDVLYNFRRGPREVEMLMLGWEEASSAAAAEKERVIGMSLLACWFSCRRL